MTAAERLIDLQIEAYNARDLERFVATYSTEIEVFRPPATAPVLSGMHQLEEFYSTQRFCHPGLHAEILGRIAIGNLVADHERVLGLPGGPVVLLATYEVTRGLIRRVWLFSPTDA
jgi:hypothetical protein